MNFSYNHLALRYFYNFLQLDNTTNDKTIDTSKMCSFCDTEGVTLATFDIYFLMELTGNFWSI